MEKILLPHQFYFPYLDITRDRVTQQKLDAFEISLTERTDRRSLVYVHLPFCNSECSFCGFDKAYDISQMSRYIEILKSEIDYYAGTPYVQDLHITGIHIGGGTPTLLPEQLLGDVIDMVRGRFRADHVPLNIECSPITVTQGIIDLLRGKNVSRVSIGVQTFDGRLRNCLNIRSSLDDTYAALARLRNAGIITYVDIMYGFPDLGVGDQTKRVLSDIHTAIELDVDGVDFSQYYPFHNPLAQRISREGLQFPTTDELVNLIIDVTALLESRGYMQSTEYIFRKQGEILLEKAYFGISDCVGIGSGSLGLLNGFKYKNNRYSHYMKSKTPAILSLRELSEDELERIPIVGFPKLLRLPKEILSERMEARYRGTLLELIDKGLLDETPDEFILTARGKAFINNIFFMMLDEKEQKEIENKLKILRLH